MRPFDLDLEFSTVAGPVRLERRIARWPFVVGRVLGSDLVVQQAGGGLHDGDRRRQRVVAGPGVDVRVRGQGAVLVHPPSRAAHADSDGESDGDATGGVEEFLDLRAAGGARLVHLSEPRLLLPGASFAATTVVHRAPGSVVVVAEHLARSSGSSRVSTELRVHGAAGELLALDRTELPPPGAEGGGFTAHGTVAVLGDTVVQSSPEVAGALVGVSDLPRGAGVLVRWCARDVASGRRVEAAVLAGLSAGDGQHPLAQGEDRGLGPAADAELGQDVFDVGGDGPAAGVQVPGDLLVRGA